MGTQKIANYYVETLKLPIIPCYGKKPAIKEWQQRTTTSIEELNKWFGENSIQNIGLVLGTASQIVGIDIDGVDATKELHSWANGALPETWAFTTPSGGMRMLYRAPKDQALKKYSKKLPGEHCELALLGDGQQTIMPPSTVNGKAYRWLTGRSPDKQNLADAPQWLLDRMSGKFAESASAGAASKPNKLHEAVFTRLANQCSLFKFHLQEQKDTGVSEDEWHNWTRLLTNANSPEVATSFSLLSKKHDARSEQRLQDLVAKKTPAMARCTTFGCSLEQIEKCHGKLNENDKGEITNSPGAFIQSNGSVVSLPTNPVYKPYIDALEDVPDYTLNDKGCLTGFDPKGNPIELANFVAKPIKEVIRDDGESFERTYRIEGILQGGRPLEPIDVKLADFLSMKWATEEWGIEVSFKPGFTKKELCRDAIQNMAKGLQRHHVFTHVGWRQLKSKKWVYLHANGCIGKDNISLDIEKELQKYVLPDAKSIEDPKLAAKASWRLLKVAPYHITIPLLALVYLSPLVEAFRKVNNEPNFVVWLHGTTGSRKTTIGQLFLSHFGQFSSKTPPASFKDTANNIERKAFSTKDMLLLIDDYHPEASRYEATKMATTAQRVLRMYGDRIGRGRLKSTTEYQKNYVPRGMALVTGEDVPTGESTVARLFEAEITRDDVDLELLTKLQKYSPLLAEAMVGYIQWLIPKMNELPEMLAESFEENRSYFLEHAAHGRLSDSAAWLLTAFDQMLSYQNEMGVLSGELADKWLLKAKQVLLEGIMKQNKLVQQQKPEEVFIKIVQLLLESGKAHIQAIGTTSSTANPLEIVKGTHLGWYDDSKYYLFPSVTFSMVQKHLLSQGENFAVTEQTLWKHLEQANMISVEKGKDEKVTHRLPKKTISKPRGNSKPYRPRLLHLHAHLFESN